MATRMIALLACALALGFLQADDTDAQAAPDALMVKRLIDEYIKDETDDSRRREIEKTLFDARAAELSSAVKSVFKDDSIKRERVYDLALYFQIRGLWSTIEKYLEKEPLLVAAVGICSEDKGASATIVKKWKESTPGSEMYSGLGNALINHGVDMSVIDDVKRIGVDKEATSQHRKDSLKMLKAWTGFEAEDPDEIADKFQKFIKPLSNDFKRYPVSGMDLCGRLGWKRENATRRGRNFKLDMNGTIINGFTPPGFDKGSLKVTFWVYLPKDPDAYIGFIHRDMRGSGTGLNGVSALKDKWIVKHEYGDIKLDCKAETWHKVMLTAEYREQSCRLGIFINGKGMYQGGYMDVYVLGLQVESTSGGVVVSSIDYQRG
jgi:hypothetical protein